MSLDLRYLLCFLPLSVFFPLEYYQLFSLKIRVCIQILLLLLVVLLSIVWSHLKEKESKKKSKKIKCEEKSTGKNCQERVLKEVSARLQSLENLPGMKTFLEKLVQRTETCKRNKGSKRLFAAFDFDGTIVREDIPWKGRHYALQPWIILWAANILMADNDWVFPLFQTTENIVKKVEFLESMSIRCSQKPKSFSKFNEIVQFFYGMKANEVRRMVLAFCLENQALTYAYIPLLDIMEYLYVNGVDLFIVTGSFPILVLSFIECLKESVRKSTGKEYTFSIPVEFCIGNQTKLTRNGLYSHFYDDQFTNDAQTVVYGDGKAMAINGYVRELIGQDAQAVACVGNSSGDVMMLDLIARMGGVVAAVNPNDRLKERRKEYEALEEMATILIPLGK